MTAAFYAAGCLAWIAAIWLGYDAVSLSVDVDGVANLQAMHFQAVGIQMGMGLAIIGTLFIGFGALLERKG